MLLKSEKRSIDEIVLNFSIKIRYNIKRKIVD